MVTNQAKLSDQVTLLEQELINVETENRKQMQTLTTQNQLIDRLEQELNIKESLLAELQVQLHNTSNELDRERESSG